MEDSFSSDFNGELAAAKYDSSTNVVSDIVGGATASVVDFGASVWNALPGTTNVDTGDLLKNVSNDALRVYQENPDTIHAASFIGGIFMPVGIATKGMALARAGAKGVGWFSEAGKVAQTAKVAELFKTAGAETVAYKEAVRSLYVRGAANQALDAVVAEAAIVMAMNAHPLMEDYIKDPVKHFTIGALLGGTLGAGAGIIADSFAIKSITGLAKEEMLQNVLKGARTLSADMTNAVALQSESQTIANMNGIIEMGIAKGKTIATDSEMRLATMAKTDAELSQREIFNTMASAEMKALPEADQVAHMKRMADMPEMYGVEKVTFLGKEEAIAKGYVKPANMTTTAKPELTKDVLYTDGTIGQEAQKVIYYPDIDQYAVIGSQLHYGGASTLVDDLGQAEARLGKNFYKAPNHDSVIELMGTSAPSAQADVVGKISAYSAESMKPTEFAKATISTSDSSSLTAALHRLRVDPEMAGKTVKITDQSNYHRAALDAQIVASGGLSTKKYSENIAKTVNKVELNKPDHIGITHDSSVSAEVTSAVRSWIGGDQLPLTQASSSYFAKAWSASNMTAEHKAQKALFASIYESKSSIALRKVFKQEADKEGYIYLYRGTHTSTLKGSAALESMTTNFDKAAEFAHAHGQGTGQVSMYKIHVDDIVMGFNDIAGKAADSTEIVVRASARVPEVAMSASGKLKYAAEQAHIIKPPSEFVQAGASDLERMIREAKANEIDALIANGFPATTVSLRTNTPTNIVEAYMANPSKGSDVLTDILANHPAQNFDRTTGNLIGTLDQAKEALGASHKPLLLSGNMKKNPYIEAHASLDKSQMDQINSMFTELVLAGSQSATAREFGEFLAKNARERDFFVGALAKANNENAGNAFATSMDQFTRRMGDVGPIVGHWSKEFTGMINRTIGKVVDPIKKAMDPLSKDPAAIVEFANFLNLHHSVGGWRTFNEATGELMQKVMKDVVQADGTTKKMEVLEALTKEGKPFAVTTPSVRTLIKEMEKQGPELKNLANTSRKIMGVRDVNDIGLWIPTFNPLNKSIAYVNDLTTGKTKLLWAHNDATLATKVNEYRRYLDENGLTKEQIVVLKGEDQRAWSQANGRLDSVHMENADTALLKKGSTAEASVRADLGIFGELIGGYEHSVNSSMRSMIDVSIPEITNSLDRMSSLNTFMTSGQPKGLIKSLTTGPKDTAALIKNAITGNSSLGEYGGWKLANQTFETGLSYGVSALQKVWDGTVGPLTKTRFGGTKALDAATMEKVDYAKMSLELKSRGIANPWEKFDAEAAVQYGLSKLEDHPDISKRLVFAGSSLAATVLLRFGELAQPLVNMISLPILTHLAAAQKMPAEFMGVKLATIKGVSGPQIIFEGARASNSPHWAALGAEWEKAGYFSPMISEINNTMHMTRALDKGVIAATERAVDSSFVNMMSKPSDMAETMVRRQTMFTGAVLAKRLYPELDNNGITLFARDFMDKAVGNFHAGQRPVMFQGTLGVALGLFQTYSLTLAQSVYRHMELKNYRAIGEAAMLQTGIFGSGSLPGFNAVSQAIGTHFSDDHTDLVTGSYRALPDAAATSLIYGLPSQLGIGTSTRGDSNPRFPGIGGDTLAVVNFSKQAVQSVQTMADAVGNRDKSVPAAFAEALSLQSISRPLARAAELATGYSVTQKGNTVQTPEEVWTFAGVAARVIGTRPAQEVKLRDAIHLRSFYGAADSKNRSDLMNEVKQRVRAGTLNESDISTASEKYFRMGGTPTGWRSAYSSAIASENTDGKEIFVDKLKPTSPLNYMINNMDGYSD